MADDYIELEITTESTELSDDAIDRLQNQWPTWEPNDGDLEVIQIETIGSMAADLGQTAALVPPAIIQTIGQSLFGIVANEGTPATATIQVTFVDSVGYTIPAGSEFDIDGFAFVADNDVSSTPGGSTTVSVPVTAAEVGIDYNGLTGVDVSPITAFTFVSTLTISAPTSGGLDEDTDDTYLTRLLVELKLYGKSLVTARDYELQALSYSDVGWAKASNDGARAVAFFGLQPNGTVLSSARKTALTNDFNAGRLVNTTFTIYDPAFGIVNAVYAVKQYPGYDPTDLISRINTQLTDVLQPLNWGRPKYVGDLSTQEWIADPIVRRSKIIDLIGDVEGVNYVYSLVLSGTNQAGGAALTVDGTSQKSRLTYSGTITSGTFQLVLDGQSTSAIQYNDGASAIRLALEALSNVEPGDVTVTGSIPTIDITFGGAYFGRSRTLTVTGSTLVGGSVAVSTPTAAVIGNGDLTLPQTHGVGLPVPGTFTGYVVS